MGVACGVAGVSISGERLARSVATDVTCVACFRGVIAIQGQARILKMAESMSLRVSLASLVATLALAACPGDDSASSPSLQRVDPGAPSDVCPAGGSTVSHGLDSNGNGVLDDTEVDGCEYVCQDGPDPAIGDVLTATTEEPAGVHCPDGGTRVDSGLDKDQDGQLDPEEIDRSEYICRGAEVPTQLTSVAVEAAGEHCEFGGVAVHQGADLDDDGVLDDPEIETTSYVCDPPPPASDPAELSELAIEPAGAHCAAGGSVLHTGHDDDGDGLLDAGEIEHSEYLCDGVLVGDYNIDSPQAAEALAGIQVITGNLNVDPADILYHYDIVLPDLRIVGGDVVSELPLYLDSFAAPELVRIGGNLLVESQRVKGLTLPKLAEVNGYVFVALPEMDGIALPALERVDGMLSTDAGGTVVDLRSLRTVGYDLRVQTHAEQLVMPELMYVGGLDLAGAPDLVELRAPKLQRVERRMRLIANELTTIELPFLRVVGEDLQVYDNPIDTLSFPGLEVVGGELYIFEQPSKTIELPRLKTVGKLDLTWSGITALDLPALEEAGEIEILRNNELVSIAAPKLRKVGTVWMSHMPKLVDLTGLGGLEEVEDSMTIFNCTALVDFTAFTSLDTVGILELGGNDALVSLGFPALRTVNDYLSIGMQPAGNLALATADLPALVFANGMIIQGNHAMTQLQMPQLSQITTTLRVHYNAALPACVVDAFHAGLAHKPTEYDPYRNDGVCPL
jgi:hypothetical protein